MYPTDFSQGLRDALWQCALRASSTATAPGAIERYMIEWVRTHWPKGEWRDMPPDEVADDAYTAWLNADHAPTAYQQGRLF